jgi:glycosyltransferase involved in cell wall biosynthesis
MDLRAEQLVIETCAQVDAAPREPSRILYIVYASPTPSRLGPARRHYHILEQLIRFYDVSLLSIGSRSDAQALERHFGNRLHGFTLVRRSAGRGRRHLRKVARTMMGRCDFLPALERGLRQACARLTATRDFDAIVLSSVLLRSLPLPVDVPLVADTHNVEFDVLRRTAAYTNNRLRRYYARRQWPATRREERCCGEAVDLLFSTSARDRRVFERELGLRRVAVVPNGIDLAEFVPSGQSPVPDTILFSGLMSYYPNQQAVCWFINEVFPAVLRSRPAARLVVAGAAPPRWLSAMAGPRIEVTGFVPDIRPYIARAAVAIAPLLIGGGTRVKILEALAMERPVISTSLGAEGLDLTHGASLLIADTPAEFVHSVVAVLEDQRLGRQLGSHGRLHVAQHFDWNRIGNSLSRLLASTIGLVCRDQSARASGVRAAALAGP